MKRKKFFKDLVQNTDAYKKKWLAEIREEHPHLTEEQVRAAWDQLVHNLGL